ncbi:uncharacterized protein BDR25DRAFT_390344 [Lindgomyces ingoldianus]|uniref:Uncharacterized protein n=1 Tax=Lindgomyces ingoldianus TaxID=673940 RepID=A0ACB6RF88_9PLEO|nr:uncharacterized protein BDR25DRAFT_390344 [Lindgomyces ingoldianus]KAF2477958.1 hypothetical protein BDR25DRAFT_390344 [Lindgomyces ingoldianus]
MTFYYSIVIRPRPSTTFNDQPSPRHRTSKVESELTIWASYWCNILEVLRVHRYRFLSGCRLRFYFAAWNVRGNQEQAPKVPVEKKGVSDTPIRSVDYSMETIPIESQKLRHATTLLTIKLVDIYSARHRLLCRPGLGLALGPPLQQVYFSLSTNRNVLEPPICIDVPGLPNRDIERQIRAAVPQIFVRRWLANCVTPHHLILLISPAPLPLSPRAISNSRLLPRIWLFTPCH